ncbi:hypothetical protein MH117_14045 [Paenibacillus sp. ACRRX]|uniref:hypothetical protein n=1 Tax=Paenibacillus sp. ACRRX TaxID=2918206 RepID=UPI001EF46B39|nr:hypothetical protein [Paenibacillus sp. ACRRX]MCG7408548.1 hypothetical protein [Paenibacillus sp. ACRRX]
MGMTIIAASPLAGRIPTTIHQLQHILTTLTLNPVRISHTPFIEIALSPKETIQISTTAQLKHQDSPFRLKRDLAEDEILITFSPEKGLLVIASTEAVLEQACMKLMMLLRQQCAVIPGHKPRLEELFWNGSSDVPHAAAL